MTKIKAHYTTINPRLQLAANKSGDNQALRLWLFLRWVDCAGSGWVPEAEARKEIEAANLFTWRHARRVINSAPQFFTWSKGKGAITLTGARAVAHYYGQRMTGLNIKMPISVLTGKLKGFRSFCYAAYHAGRRDQLPMARGTLESITGYDQGTLREYEKIQGVEVVTNYAIGPRESRLAIESAANSHKRGIFIYNDVSGSVAEQGAKFVAWRLPNAYRIVLDVAPKGRNRKINKCLVNKEKQGKKVYFSSKQTKAWATLPRSRSAEVALQNYKNTRQWFGAA